MPVIGFLRSATLADVRAPRGRVPPGPEGSGLSSRARTSRSNIAGRRVRSDRLPALAADLVRRQVAVIVANSHLRRSRPRRQPRRYRSSSRSAATRSGSAWSPASTGRAAMSPGVDLFTAELGAKRLELLRQLVPKATTIAVLVNPTTPGYRGGAKRRAGGRAGDRAATPRCSMSAASATSRPPSQRSSQRGLARCSSAPARS